MLRIMTSWRPGMRVTEITRRIRPMWAQPVQVRRLLWDYRQHRRSRRWRAVEILSEEVAHGQGN